jgi:hypothetical protein
MYFHTDSSFLKKWSRNSVMLYHWVFSDFFFWYICSILHDTTKKVELKWIVGCLTLRLYFTLIVCELIKKFLDIFSGRYFEMRQMNDADRICRKLVLQNAKHESGTGWKWRAMLYTVTGPILSLSFGLHRMCWHHPLNWFFCMFVRCVAAYK